jgi:hypothetical protein
MKKSGMSRRETSFAMDVPARTSADTNAFPVKNTTPDVRDKVPGTYSCFSVLPGETFEAKLSIDGDGTYRYLRAVLGDLQPPSPDGGPPTPDVTEESGRWSLISKKPTRITLKPDTGGIGQSLVFTDNELLDPDTPGFNVLTRDNGLDGPLLSQSGPDD